MRSKLTASALAIAGITLTATAVVAGGASADVDKPAEGPGDVYTYDKGNPDPHPSTQSTNVDLVRHVVRHGPKMITVRSWYADLRTPTTNETLILSTDFKVTGGATFNLTATATNDDKHGTASLSDQSSTDICKGLDLTFDYARDTVIMKMPRSCLGTPRWLRYSSSVYLSPHQQQTSFIDDVGDGGFSKRLRKG
jgi:hypothetical protein